jgi:anti-sigma B factor antagonist
MVTEEPLRAFQSAPDPTTNGGSPDGDGRAFGITHEPLGGGGWLFTIEGELDLATADRLRDALEGPLLDGASGIVFDLAGCSFVDSSGLAVLLEARKALDGSAQETRIALVSPAPQPERLLRMTTVDTVLPVFESRDQAASVIGSADAAPSPR